MYLYTYVYMHVCIYIYIFYTYRYVYIIICIFVYVMHVNVLCMLAGPVSPEVGYQTSRGPHPVFGKTAAVASSECQKKRSSKSSSCCLYDCCCQVCVGGRTTWFIGGFSSEAIINQYSRPWGLRKLVLLPFWPAPRKFGQPRRSSGPLVRFVCQSNTSRLDGFSFVSFPGEKLSFWDGNWEYPGLLDLACIIAWSALLVLGHHPQSAVQSLFFQHKSM